MKKWWIAAAAASILTLTASIPTFAGTWKLGAGENCSRWWYDNEDGTWLANGWHWVDGNRDNTAECYYFNNEGWLLTGTTTPDGYQVDNNGAWVSNGVVQTKWIAGEQNQNPNQAAAKKQSAGWVTEGSSKMYYTGSEYVTSQWKKINGKQYYFDSNGVMVTDLWEIDGELYYFSSNGVLKTKDFTLDDVRYFVDSDGVIYDTMDLEDWEEEQGKKTVTSASKGSSSLSQNSSNKNSSNTASVEDGHNFDYAYEVFEIVNKERAKKGVKKLTWSDEIAELTDIRAEELDEKYSHERPNGERCFSIFDEYDLTYSTAGENIAMGQRSPEQVMDAWMNSDGHRKNILNKDFTSMAVGCYSSNGLLHWVQLFANLK